MSQRNRPSSHWAHELTLLSTGLAAPTPQLGQLWRGSRLSPRSTMCVLKRTRRHALRTTNNRRMMTWDQAHIYIHASHSSYDQAVSEMDYPVEQYQSSKCRTRWQVELGTMNGENSLQAGHSDCIVLFSWHLAAIRHLLIHSSTHVFVHS